MKPDPHAPAPGKTHGGRPPSTPSLFGALFFWVAVTGAWFLLLQRTGTPGGLGGLALLAGVFVLCIGLAWLWVRHNVGLARRFAGRRQRHRGEETWVTDLAGRSVDVERLDDLRGATRVVVAVGSDGIKRYTVEERS